MMDILCWKCFQMIHQKSSSAIVARWQFVGRKLSQREQSRGEAWFRRHLRTAHFLEGIVICIFFRTLTKHHLKKTRIFGTAQSSKQIAIITPVYQWKKRVILITLFYSENAGYPLHLLVIVPHKLELKQCWVISSRDVRWTYVWEKHLYHYSLINLITSLKLSN